MNDSEKTRQELLDEIRNLKIQHDLLKKSYEKAVHDTEQLYKMISELTTDYIFKLGVHADGKVTMDFLSDNYLSITGRNKSNAGVDFWDGFIFSEDLPMIKASLAQLVKKADSMEIECRSYIHENKMRWVSVISRSEWDEKEQRVVSIVGAVKDITVRKHAEEEIKEKNKAIEAKNREYSQLNEDLRNTNLQLQIAKEKAEESNRLKTSFLQNMSHEIRTPMNAIMGFSSLLLENIGNSEKIERFSKIINQRCNDLLEIINDILDISKIESGQLPLNNEKCNVGELFSDLFHIFKEHQKRIGKEQLGFKMHAVPSELNDLIIMVDIGKLKQILINLIGNAFKFTKVGYIEAGFRLNGPTEAIFYVTDTGIGIPYDKHDIIFERFVQLANDRENYGGTGLGLPIVKGLVNIMGGKIWLESETDNASTGKPGKTTFYFTLPR